MSMTRDDLVKLQHAFIRSLGDEVDRCPESDERAAALREQIREEEERLAEWADDPGGNVSLPRKVHPFSGAVV